MAMLLTARQPSGLAAAQPKEASIQGEERRTPSGGLRHCCTGRRNAVSYRRDRARLGCWLCGV